MIYDTSPCDGCPERFPACSDRCPRDDRGEYGYKAWKADYRKKKAAKKEYMLRRREEFLRSEQCMEATKNYIRSRSGRSYRRN